MFEKDKISIDISRDRIAIVVGTKTKIKKATILETPKGSYLQDRIENTELLSKVIKDYLVKDKIRVKDVSFTVKGQDVITRHTILPLLGEEPMREAVSWELRQYLNDRVDEYYYDYEILQELGEGKAKNADVIIAAVEMNKIDAYVEIAERLNLELVALDTYATIGARMLRSSKVFKDKEDVIGLITLNSDTASFHIASSGKLEIEKYQNMGILGNNLDQIDSIEAYNEYLYKIDLTEEDINEESTSVRRIINTISSYFNSIIQFYSVGKVKKNLDRIYLIGSGAKVKGVKEEFSKIFNTEIVEIDDFKTLRYNVKVPRSITLSDYFYSYGLMLNNSEKELNLLPYNLKLNDLRGKKKAVYVASIIFTLVVFLGGIGYLKGKEMYLNSSKDKLINKINSNQENVDKLNTLENDISLYNSHIEKVKVLNEQKDKKTDDLIRDIQKLIPGEVTVSSFSITGSNISISGASSNYDKISEFWANVREDARFKDSHIASITKGEASSSFTLEILVQGGQS
ncbi:pilus assembly protein PilM [Clostridium sp. YIM B02506]|uniref:pilus assembly protein PilM n=1 Tax=Clostridium sp. YIM B02506 TaxID=2910680 RepID=UPI001EED4730|nr:pilus assembly protein PilM [Clostridium sp. YIM B02506]